MNTTELNGAGCYGDSIVFFFSICASFTIGSHLDRGFHEFDKLILFINGHTFPVPAVLRASLIYPARKRTVFKSGFILALKWLDELQVLSSSCQFCIRDNCKGLSQKQLAKLPQH